MRHRRALALLLAAGMLCSGCSTGAISSNYRPVEDLALIQTIGVDRAPEGVCLSAATGKACENEAPKRMTQSGVSSDRILALHNAELRNAPVDLDWVRAHTVIIHYCGRLKPWKPHYVGVLDVFYHELMEEIQK